MTFASSPPLIAIWKPHTRRDLPQGSLFPIERCDSLRPCTARKAERHSHAAHWFLERYAAGQEMHVASAAMKALMQYEWPGNVRELDNLRERAVALGDGQVIDLGDLPPSIASSASVHETHTKKTTILDPDLAERMSTTKRVPPSLPRIWKDIEATTIQRVFEQVKGDKTLAGRMLGISRATLYRKLKRYNIGVNSPASSAHTLQ